MTIPWEVIEKFNRGEELDTEEIKILFKAYPAILRFLGIDTVPTTSVIQLLYAKRVLGLKEQVMLFNVIWKIEHWLETEKEVNRQIWRDVYIDGKEYWQVAVERLGKERPISNIEKKDYADLIYHRLKRMTHRFKNYLEKLRKNSCCAI